MTENEMMLVELVRIRCCISKVECSIVEARCEYRIESEKGSISKSRMSALSKRYREHKVKQGALCDQYNKIEKDLNNKGIWL